MPLLTSLLLASWATVLLTAAPSAGAPSPEQLRLAERLYREGVLPSGRPLHAVRAALDISGAEAACVLCHRRSGMGTAEGGRIVPPITGRFLFRPRAATLAQMDARHTRGPDLAHAYGRERPRPPYDEGSLLAAVREGAGPGNGPLEELMPRYKLNDADAHLLVEYLRQLSAGWSPGVSREEIHFATVITPEVDPVRKKALRDVLQAFFTLHNSGTALDQQRDRSFRGASVATYRSWHLHFWELDGPPETWGAQLETQYRKQPVFALVSGLSESTWAPVHRFAERKGLPCWFPTVDVPVVDSGFYGLYYTGGVALEGAVLGKHLSSDRRATRILQIRGDDVAAASGEEALLRTLQGAAHPEGRLLARVDARALRQALADVRSTDAVVLWMRAQDLAVLSEVPPPPAPVYLSTLLSWGESAPIPASWRAKVHLVYPFELPDKRRANTARFYAWLRTRNLPVVDERSQGDAYLAGLLLTEKLDQMLESLYRDYLVELAEDFLSERVSTVMYHTLGLGPGQRVASKGAFLVRFAAPEGRSLVAESGWIVP